MTARHQRGSSLLELLVALLVGTIVAGSAFLCIRQFESAADQWTAMLDRDRSLVVAPLLFERWIAAAGCGLAGTGQGLASDGTVLQVQADFDGPAGLPDGSLDDPFESIAIRSAGDTLQLRSGAGSFQPVMDFVPEIDFELNTPELVQIRWSAAAHARLGPDPPSIHRRIAVYLWNRRPQLFKE